jgi:Xaa-Pro aminopeptidase
MKEESLAMTKREELAKKLDRIRGFMERKGYDGVVFGAQHNFSWLTGGGDNQIIHGSELGFVHLLVTGEKVCAITNNIEMPRISAEEILGLDLEQVEFLWTAGNPSDEVGKIVGTGKIAADIPLPGGANEGEALSLLRVPLTDAEVLRYRDLAGLCTAAVEQTMREVKPGMSEFEIQGLIGGKLMARGVYPVVLLVGTDERIFNFRHPMPTEKKLDRYCMVVICAQRWGLVLNMTRLAHFGAIPAVLSSRYEALHRVDMAYVTASRPGNSMKDIFTAGKAEYAEQGYGDEELKHYQGGTCGYLTREQGLHPASGYVIQEGEIIAHNPTITGTKIEDSILVKGGGFEVLTRSQDWPSKEIEYGGITLERPEILER